MYPLGASHPCGLMDLAGNVWEWTASPWKPGHSARVVRGGSWDNSCGFARCAARARNLPDLSYVDFGFRCVSPV